MPTGNPILDTVLSFDLTIVFNAFFLTGERFIGHLQDINNRTMRYTYDFSEDEARLPFLLYQEDNDGAIFREYNRIEYLVSQQNRRIAKYINYGFTLLA
jgi:hypothetical protein